MNYNELFSNVVSRSKASAIRELLKVISRPGIISFAGGLPDPTLFPTKEIQNIFDTILTNSAREALQYGSTEGQDSFKKELVRMLKETENITVTPEQILVVSASQQALDMAARMFINPGDSIITACPTYLGALQAFQVTGADILGVASDHDGVLVTDLKAKLELLKQQGKPCKFIYLVPDFQNPTGTTIPQDRREQILALAKEYKTFILEDSPYRQVRFEGTAPKTFYELDGGAGNVMTLFTFSKVFVPGFRLG
ncbi:MAG: PLP-dependent aminotransferase family protein, partial [Elusimicrobiaceae bacterium]|nr:PLP-dependent aminotransferase family protein [Elusimicrobiaceae bacterium]